MFLILGITSGIEKFALVYIPGITQNKTTLISQNGFDLDHGINFSENRLELVVSRSEIHTLDYLEIEYTIQHEDLDKTTKLLEIIIRLPIDPVYVNIYHCNLHEYGISIQLAPNFH